MVLRVYAGPAERLHQFVFSAQFSFRRIKEPVCGTDGQFELSLVDASRDPVATTVRRSYLKCGRSSCT